MSGLVKQLAIIAVSGFCVLHHIAASAKTNILWINIDDQSPWYGSYGKTKAQTPNIDALAREGVVFERGYASSPVCGPSRSAIIAGSDSIRTGTHDMRSGRTPEHEIILPEDVRTLPELFRKAQYETYNSDKDDFNFTDRKNDLYSIYDKTDSAIKHANYKGGGGPFPPKWVKKPRIHAMIF